MSHFTDRDYLQKNQYRDAENLRKRGSLHEKYSTNPINWFTWVFDHMALKGRILELGCGPGTLWQKNRQRIRPEWNIVLSDFSMGMVQEASNAGNFAFIQSDAGAIPFPDASFDAVIANHMLYHVPDLRQTLGEIRRILKEDGVFYAATNGKKHLIELHKLIKQGLDIELNNTTLLGNFTLETGGPFLAEYFSNVEMDVYKSQLCVTDIDPLVEYTETIISGYDAAVTPEQVEKFRGLLAKEIEAKGAVWIQKSVGLFCARP